MSSEDEKKPPPFFCLCLLLQEDLKASFVRIITMEDEDFWKDGKPPEKEDDLLSHPMPMDIWTVGFPLRR